MLDSPTMQEQSTSDTALTLAVEAPCSHSLRSLVSSRPESWFSVQCSPVRGESWYYRRQKNLGEEQAQKGQKEADMKEHRGSSAGVCGALRRALRGCWPPQTHDRRHCRSEQRRVFRENRIRTFSRASRLATQTVLHHQQPESCSAVLTQVHGLRSSTSVLRSSKSS